MYLSVNVFRKDPVRDLWEVWSELMNGESIGKKLKTYVDDALAAQLMRGNQFEIKVSQVFRYHITIEVDVKCTSLKEEEE